MNEESSFSDGDWGSFASEDIKQMVVIDKNSVFTLTKPDDYKWSSEQNNRAAFKEKWNATLGKIEQADTKGAKSADQLIHETNVELSKELGFQYDKTPKRAQPNAT